MRDRSIFSTRRDISEAEEFSAMNNLLQEMGETFAGETPKPHKLLALVSKFGLGPKENSIHGGSPNGPHHVKHGAHPTAIRDHLIKNHGFKRVQSKTQYGQVSHIVAHPQHGHLKITGNKSGYNGYHATEIAHNKKGFGYMY